MKKFILILIVFLFSFKIFSQNIFPTQGINYQAIARNTTTGAPIIKSNISIQCTIFDSITSSNFSQVYVEPHSGINTSPYGLFTIVIGRGSNSANFSSIDWSKNQKYLEIAIDTNGTGYISMPRVKLYTVPYAFYSDRARLADSVIGGGSGNTIWNRGVSSGAINKVYLLDTSDIVGIGTTIPSAKLEVIGTAQMGLRVETSGGTQSAIVALSNGTGPAASIFISNTASSASAIDVQTNGTGGSAIYARNSGTSSSSASPNHGAKIISDGGGTLGTNIAGYFSAKNGSTNWAGYFDNGNVYIRENLAIGTQIPNASAVVDIASNSKGILIPRMSHNQMTLISSPSNGLLVYNTDSSKFYYNKGSSSIPNWIPLMSGNNTLTGNYWSSSMTNEIYPSNLGNNVGIGTQFPTKKLEVLGKS